MKLRIEDLLGNYHKLIMDPVHGGIPLLKHEIEIIDHPLFQRLRFICQNDILSLVFPGATHSRFLHSIGAMHVGGRMFMALIENCLKQQPCHQGIETKTLEAISYFNQLVRCACLLHDSGHSSFSHQFSRTPAIQALLAQSDRLEKLWSDTDKRLKPKNFQGMIEHEHYSVRVAYEILSQVDGQDQLPVITDILGLMETSELAPSETFYRHALALRHLIPANWPPHLDEQAFVRGLQTMLSHLVSGEVDADRADYMLRDGFHSSVTIGGFNLDHLLSNLHFGICSQTGWMGIAIADKGIGSLEDFVYSRHQMYRQVYAHKTAQGFDWLLRAAIEEVMAQEDILAVVDQGLSNIHEFKFLTDNYFWEAFRTYAIKHPRSYAHCILNRVRMKYLATRTNLTQHEEDTYRSFLAQENDCESSQIICCSITARFTKIRDDFAEIKVLSKGRGKQPDNYRNIPETSQFFGKFTDDRITHFYIDPISQIELPVTPRMKSNA